MARRRTFCLEASAWTRSLVIWSAATQALPPPGQSLDFRDSRPHIRYCGKSLRVPNSRQSVSLRFRDLHGQLGVLDTQVDPLVNEAFEPLVGGDPAAKFLHAFLADVLRAA